LIFSICCADRRCSRGGRAGASTQDIQENASSNPRVSGYGQHMKSEHLRRYLQSSHSHSTCTASAQSTQTTTSRDPHATPWLLRLRQRDDDSGKIPPGSFGSGCLPWAGPFIAGVCRVLHKIDEVAADERGWPGEGAAR